MTDCIFCKIASGEVACDKVYEDEDLLAFLDISPVNPGHTLVIPKKHYETVLDTPDDIMCKIAVLCKKLSKAVIANQDGGANIHANIMKPGEQLVMHSHFHVIPRHVDDGHTHDWVRHDYSNDAEKEMYRKCLENSLKK